jgi:hypothetical protein
MIDIGMSDSSINDIGISNVRMSYICMNGTSVSDINMSDPNMGHITLSILMAALSDMVYVICMTDELISTEPSKMNIPSKFGRFHLSLDSSCTQSAR